MLMDDELPPALKTENLSPRESTEFPRHVREFCGARDQAVRKKTILKKGHCHGNADCSFGRFRSYITVTSQLKTATGLKLPSTSRAFKIK